MNMVCHHRRLRNPATAAAAVAAEFRGWLLDYLRAVVNAPVLCPWCSRPLRPYSYNECILSVIHSVSSDQPLFPSSVHFEVQALRKI